MFDYRVLPAGDTALVVEFGDRIDRRLNGAVLSLAHSLDANRIEGVLETVPTFRSLMIHYEPLAIPAASLAERVNDRMQNLKTNDAAGCLWRLPVCYDESVAIDLDDVARRTGLSKRQVIERHSAPIYHVYMLGFLPGQAYMGEIPPELALDRLETPRTKIPAGSVAITGSMSCVFPLETPCGWHVIGRCPVPLWNHARATALISPGDRVALAPVSAEEHEKLSANAAQADFRIEPVDEGFGAAA